jgi:large subunit ribosomal protein L21
MYAIVDIAGQQFKVEKDQKIYVHRLENEEGSVVDFNRVLLIDDDGKIQVGAPTVKNAVVTAKVISHMKGDKVKIFKKKRRKGYKVLNGHRQFFTELVVQGIAENVTSKKKETVKEEVKAVKEEVKAETKTAPAKEAPVKKAVTKSTAKTSGAKPKAKTATQKTTAAKKTTTAAKTAKPKAKATEPKKTEKKETKKDSE